MPHRFEAFHRPFALPGGSMGTAAPQHDTATLCGGAANPFGLTARTLANPKGIGNLDAFNREEVRAIEIPAANGIGTARSVAKAYGCVATGGSELGLTADVLDALPSPRFHRPTGCATKCSTSTPHSRSATSNRSPSPGSVHRTKRSEHPGAGGSFGFADPDTGIGFAYAMNKAGFHLYNDPRELALRQALFHDIVGTRSQT